MTAHDVTPPMKRSWMDRIIDTIEWIAAGFVGIVALDIFLSVLLRNTLNYSIPDSFDIGRMLLGILIFWGIAATSYRGGHITVDLIWANVEPKYQRWIDVFATLVLLFVVTVQTWTLFDKVKAESGHEVYKLTPEQIAQWKKASEPLVKTWADNVRKTGADPDAAMAELRAALTKYNALAQ